MTAKLPKPHHLGRGSYRLDTFNWGSLHYNYPYTGMRLDSGKWVILNRDYKPLNYYMAMSPHRYARIDLEPFALDLRISKDEVEQLHFHTGWDEQHRFFLYNDDCVPSGAARAKRCYIDRLTCLNCIYARFDGTDTLWQERFNGSERIDPYDCRVLPESAAS